MNLLKRIKRRFWRSAKSGQCVTEEYAEEHPETTTHETTER